MRNSELILRIEVLEKKYDMLSYQISCFRENSKNHIDLEIKTEEFLDKIIERIKRKQLK